MYCRICGCKVKADAGKCPECGAQPSADFCGGFWGLVDAAESRKADSLAEQELRLEAGEKSSPGKVSESGKVGENGGRPAGGIKGPQKPGDNGRNGADVHKRSSMQVAICAGVAAVCLLFGVVQTVRLSSAQEETGTVRSELEQQKEAQSNSQKEIDRLGSENNDLLNKNSDLTKENKRIIEREKILNGQWNARNNVDENGDVPGSDATDEGTGSDGQTEEPEVVEQTEEPEVMEQTEEPEAVEQTVEPEVVEQLEALKMEKHLVSEMVYVEKGDNC